MKKWLYPALYVLLAVTLIIACKPSQKIKKTAKKVEKDTTTVKTDTARIIKEEKKETYKIGALLPFQLDLVKTFSTESAEYYLSEKEEIIPKESLHTLQFYEGMLLALDSLKKNGYNFELFVYDVPDDTLRMKKTLEQQPVLKAMHLLIGPGFNPNLRILAEFARQHKIPLVSPFSPSPSITASNPYFIMVNPTLRTHCEAMFSYVQNAFANKKIFMFHQNEENDNNIAAIFRNIAKRDTAGKNILEVNFDIDTRLDSSIFSLTERNIIFIPSFDEVFINHLIGQLKNLSSRYNLIVFGMPAWDEMESLRTEYLQKINVHLTSPFWVDAHKPTAAYLEKKFFERYKTIPAQQANLGYDIMLYFGKTIGDYGAQFPVHFQENIATVISTRFDFKPAAKNKTASGHFDFYENQYINILKFENYSLKKINE